MSKHYAGARIHALRKQHGLTQVHMAKILGLSTSYLNQLENDQRPLTVTVLLQLTQHFDVAASYFSGERDLRTIGELRHLLPDAPEDTLAELTARFPTIITQLLAARRQPTGPFDHVRDFFYEAHNYIHTLDTAAEELATHLGDGVLRRGRLAARLAEEFGVTTRFGRPHPAPRRHFDPDTRHLDLRAGLNDAQLIFEMSLQYCLLAHAELCRELVAELPPGDARGIGTLGLAQYFAAATTLPYTQLLDAARASRYDIDALSTTFGTGFETTAQRLATLQRPGAQGVPFSFIRADRAGNISKRQSSTSFHFAQTGGSCPLWVVHRAFETPNRITRQVAVMPDGRAHLWIARFVQGRASAWGTPRREFVVALGCDLSHADRLVYSDALNLDVSAATPIGPGCAVCPRERCPQRSLPHTGRAIRLDLNRTPETAYETF